MEKLSHVDTITRSMAGKSSEQSAESLNLGDQLIGHNDCRAWFARVTKIREGMQVGEPVE